MYCFPQIRMQQSHSWVKRNQIIHIAPPPVSVLAPHRSLSNYFWTIPWRDDCFRSYVHNLQWQPQWFHPSGLLWQAIFGENALFSNSDLLLLYYYRKYGHNFCFLEGSKTPHPNVLLSFQPISARSVSPVAVFHSCWLISGVQRRPSATLAVQFNSMSSCGLRPLNVSCLWSWLWTAIWQCVVHCNIPLSCTQNFVYSWPS